ncbi:MAG: GNAT family N-acetyltransferase, partial [Ruminiclostridium sp.]|nr:GNAT family N-acetyltransferase [Ruminiclostridium sp.]
RILHDSFPANELRPKANMKKTMEKENYVVYKFGSDDRVEGVTAVWKLSGYLFVEYLAVDKEIRNKGKGSLILKELRELYNTPLCLEVEPPDCDIARRRIEFYKRNGFYLNLYPYEQPAYSEKQKAVPLMIMTFGKEISEEAFIKLKKEIYREVYGK